MTKKECPACQALSKGYRTKYPLKHTCGEEPKALRPNGQDVLTFEDIKQSVLNSPLITIKDKLELMLIEDMKTFTARLVELLKVDEDQVFDRI